MRNIEELPGPPLKEVRDGLKAEDTESLLLPVSWCTSNIITMYAVSLCLSLLNLVGASLQQKPCAGAPVSNLLSTCFVPRTTRHQHTIAELSTSQEEKLMAEYTPLRTR
eukprot:scpid19186/ scgid35307/ 